MFRFILIFILVLFQSCVISKKLNISGRGDFKLSQVEFSDFKNWENDDHKSALRAFLYSCNKFAKMPQSRLIGGQITNLTAGDFRDVCDIAEVVKTMSAKQAKNFFENWFRPFLVKNNSGSSKGIFTGYYEASLKGSKNKTERFKYPIYAKPNDLNSDPYFSRAEIENGALQNKGLELFYVDDKVELFFMHIQGSGRIELNNGSEARVGFAARNNQPFIAIGNYMADQGFLMRDNISAASVKDWLKNNPDKADEVMNNNPAYIFFKINDGEYVIGGQGVPLTAEHSLAVDNQIIPYGLPIWVETSLKKSNGSKNEYSHLFVAQDTGSAIKGVIRGDIFFGFGKEAEESASYMASQGQYYVLLPINVIDRMVENKLVGKLNY